MPFDQAADAAADREIQASMYKKIHECRICGNTELIPLADLGEQYLTGVFPRQESGTTLTKGPLRLVKCHGEMIFVACSSLSTVTVSMRCTARITDTDQVST